VCIHVCSASHSFGLDAIARAVSSFESFRLHTQPCTTARLANSQLNRQALVESICCVAECRPLCSRISDGTKVAGPANTTLDPCVQPARGPASSASGCFTPGSTTWHLASPIWKRQGVRCGCESRLHNIRWLTRGSWDLGDGVLGAIDKVSSMIDTARAFLGVIQPPLSCSSP